MAKKIIIEFTESQFNAMIKMVEDNATMISCAEDEFAIPTKKNIILLQRAIDNSGVNYKINTMGN